MSTRLKGVKNYLYLATLGVEVVAPGALSGEGFFKITGKAATGSGFPATSMVNDVVYNKPAITLVSGDKAAPFTLKKLAFVTNVPQGAQKEKFENTTQIDDAKSYQEGDKPEITGSCDGYFVMDDADADLFLNRFFTMVTDDGAGARTYARPKVGTLHMFLGRNETSTVGQKEMMEYMPVIIDSITVDKPMEGPQTLSFQYTVVGSERPNLYVRTITA